MAATPWSCASAFAQQQGRNAGGLGDRKDLMSLGLGGAGYVLNWLGAAQANSKDLTGIQLVECQTCAHKGHRTDVIGNVYIKIWCNIWKKRLGHDFTLLGLISRFDEITVACVQDDIYISRKSKELKDGDV
jgi:hypothetical protein